VGDALLLGNGGRSAGHAQVARLLMRVDSNDCAKAQLGMAYVGTPVDYGELGRAFLAMSRKTRSCAKRADMQTGVVGSWVTEQRIRVQLAWYAEAKVRSFGLDYTFRFSHCCKLQAHFIHDKSIGDSSPIASWIVVPRARIYRRLDCQNLYVSYVFSDCPEELLAHYS
jgi:hypothetical protein